MKTLFRIINRTLAFMLALVMTLSLLYSYTIRTLAEGEGENVIVESTTGSAEALEEGYKYVRTDGLSEMKPEHTEKDELGIPLCDCDNAEGTELKNHTDSCARKSYLRKTYIGEKTAEEIYGDWECLDTESQDAILTFLEWDNQTKLEELKVLIEDEDIIYNGGTDKVAVAVSVPPRAFNDNVTFAVTEVSLSENDLESIKTLLDSVSSTISYLDSYAVDITFLANGEVQQPAESTLLTFTLSQQQIPETANKAVIVHMGKNGPEIVDEIYLKSFADEQRITVRADSFSSYVTVLVNDKYQATKMSDQLVGNNRYSIVDFPVTLIDYTDKDLFNTTYGSNSFNFTTGGSTTTNEVKNTGVNDGSTAATQGIVKSALNSAGYPVMQYGNDVGTVLFDTTENEWKKVYDNLDFQFIYDEITGYYEYNSSANHAQYNSSSKEIELYADTLSLANFYTPITLTNYSNEKACTLSMEDGVLICKSTNENPHFCYEKLSYAVSDYSQIYLKLYSDVSQVLQVFVTTTDQTGYSEANSIKLDMEKEKWAEYVLDLSTLNISGNLTSIRIDPGSGNATIQISDIGLLKTTGTSNGEKPYNWKSHYGGFYPFSDITDSYPGFYGKFDFDAWKDRIGAEYALISATRSIYNKHYGDTKTIDMNTIEPEHYFSLVIEQNFYMPESKQVNDKDIIFEFSGDDDLWVFIDGNLALDIGGAHTAVSGSINFTDGKVIVSNSRELQNFTTSGSAEANKVKDLSQELMKAFEEPGMHTIKIFYMERAGGVSNCLFRFNLPVVPTGDVAVSKTVTEKDGEVFDTGKEFTFEIKADGDAFAKADYTLVTMNEDGTVKSKETGLKTDNAGEFKLKHNQYATFDGINESTSITVTELAPGNSSDAIYQGTTVNGENEMQATGTTVANQELKFAFVNTYDVQKVNIYYEVVGPDGCGTVCLTDNSKAASRETFETVNIFGETVGAIATENDAYAFVGWYKDKDCTEQLTTEHTYVPGKNTEGKNFEATYYALFKPAYVDLKITKIANNISMDVDYEENQTFYFTVQGLSGNAKGINIPIVINVSPNNLNGNVGTVSVTIKQLPVGQYKVTEMGNWSWRYDLTNAEAATDTEEIFNDSEGSLMFDLTKAGETVTFTNNRTDNSWLSGDCIAENWWGGTSGVINKKETTSSN